MKHACLLLLCFGGLLPPRLGLAQAASIVKEDPVYTYVEQMPELPGGGGTEAIITAVRQKVKYPAQARRDSVQGRVLASFVVGPDGSVSTARILSGLGHGCDEAVLAAIRGLPRLRPGQQRGRPVRVALTVPVFFVLDPVNHPLQLPNYGLNGRLLLTPTGRAVAFNDHEAQGIQGRGLYFALDFGPARAEEGGRLNTYLYNGKSVQLSVVRTGAPAALPPDTLLARYIRPRFRQYTYQYPTIAPDTATLRLPSGQPAMLWTYRIPAEIQPVFLSFRHGQHLFIFQAYQKTAADAGPTRDFLLQVAHTLRVSPKPIILERLEK